MKQSRVKRNHLLFAVLLLSNTFGGEQAAYGSPLLKGEINAGVPEVLQTRRLVTGVVVDEKGQPVIGASVKVNGSKKGAITDVNGKFTLDVPAGSKLTVSSVGFIRQEVLAADGKALSVTLKENSSSLNEVVVVGFGTQKKVNLTGAVSVVSGDELAERPVASAAQALQGAVAGLQITQYSGSLDSDPSLNIRGTTTIGQGTSGSPLVLIDGMEGDINSVNPQDIASISVLKDAAASSIYGSRAPFGVILVTTKSGSKDGKVSINYNNSFRWGTPIRMKHQMNSVDFASFVNDASLNSGSGPFFSKDRMLDIQAYHNAQPYKPGQRITSDGKILYALPVSSSDPNSWGDESYEGIDDIDYYNVFYKKWNASQEHNFSATGGNEKFNYYASFGYLDQNGMLKIGDDGLKRYTATGKINAQLTDWLRFNYTFRFTRKDYHAPGNLGDYFYQFVGGIWPTRPLYDQNGYYYNTQAISMDSGGSWQWENDENYHQAGFIIEPIKGWLTHVDFNYRVTTANTHSDYQYQYRHNVNQEPVNIFSYSGVSEGNTKENYYNFQAYTEYTHSFAQKHNLHVMAGFQAEDLRQFEMSAGRDGIIIPNKPELDLTTGLGFDGSEIKPTVGGYRNRWTTAGLFGRLNYDFMGKYLLEVNVRDDGSSRFRPGNQWKLFPSVSAGWNISSEKFMQPLSSVISHLKLRASYGSLGNQNTNNWYQTYQTMSVQAAAGLWMQNSDKPNVAWAPGLVSETLSWEKIESYNLGVDFGFFGDRLTGTFDYYIRNTKNMVGNAPELPAILGTAVPVTNNTDLQTKGWELTIGWQDRLSNGLSYGIKFNVSDAQAKVTKYPNNPTQSISNYIEGQKLGQIWGLQTVGIAKSNEEMQAHLKKVDQSTLGDNWAAGDIMYADLNGDGKISWGAWTLNDHGDSKVIGNSTPRFLFGIDANAAWKGFDFRIFFQGVMKRDYWVDKSYMFGAFYEGVWWTNPLSDVQDYYRDENTWSVQNGFESVNQDAYYPRAAYSDKNLQSQTKYLQNASYIRLKNLQIGYTLPQNLTTKWHIQKLRVFFSGDNLWTGTKLVKQFDPETLGTNYGNGYPLTTTLSCGMSITF